MWVKTICNTEGSECESLPEPSGSRVRQGQAAESGRQQRAAGSRERGKLFANTHHRKLKMSLQILDIPRDCRANGFSHTENV
ncbi:unnamed protein product [Boreogadus saida]